MGFPPSGFRVMMFTIELFIHTFIHTSGQFPLRIHLQHQLKMPPPTATHLFFFFLHQNKNTNVSQAENKAIRKPVLALEQSTRKKKKK